MTLFFCKNHLFLYSVFTIEEQTRKYCYTKEMLYYLFLNKEGEKMEHYNCPSCNKECDEDMQVCMKCMKGFCKGCYEQGHLESCKGNGKIATFLAKVVLGIVIVLTFSNMTINGSEEMSVIRILFLYGFGTIPFGWSLIENIKDSLLTKLAKITGAKIKKRKKFYEWNQEDIEEVKQNIGLSILLLPWTFVSLFIKSFISALIGMILFPIEIIRFVFRKK